MRGREEAVKEGKDERGVNTTREIKHNFKIVFTSVEGKARRKDRRVLSVSSWYMSIVMRCVDE